MAEHVPQGIRGFMEYYDSVHQNPWNRLFHAFAFTQGIVSMVLLARGFPPVAAIAIGLLSYAWAWTGHFAFEKNKPATFHSPIRSLLFGFVWFFALTATLNFWPQRRAASEPAPAP
jgi:hypothetical protein